MVKKYKFDSLAAFQQFVEKEREEIHDFVWKGIKRANDDNRYSACTAEFYIMENDVYIDMVADRKDWPDTLSLALKFYEAKENYETCSEIKKLMDTL